MAKAMINSSDTEKQAETIINTKLEMRQEA